MDFCPAGRMDPEISPIIIFMLTGFAYLTFFERKSLARIQVRIGPNRAGPWASFSRWQMA